MKKKNQLGLPLKSRSSVITQSIDTESDSQRTAKAQTAESRSQLWNRIFVPPKSMVCSSSLATSRNVKRVPSIATNKAVNALANSSFWDENSNVIRGWSCHQCAAIFKNLSDDEVMFVMHIYNWGLNRARILAAKFRYKLQRPLRALLSAMNERGKSDTKRSAKTSRFQVLQLL